MIDFRYHLVSVIAIFLALGLGIVVGSTALRPAVSGALDTLSKSQAAQIAQLRANLAGQAHQLTADGSFAQSVEPGLVKGLLTGDRVVVVEAPGASGVVAGGIVTAIRQSGGTVSGEVQLQPSFLDPGQGADGQLGQLAQQLGPPDLTLQGTPQAQASQVLASAILTRDGPGQPVAGELDPVSKLILNGFAAGGFLTVNGQPGARATLAVVVIPATPPPAGAASIASQALVTMAQQLSLAGRGTVMAGSVTGSGPGSAIGVVRGGGGSHISSVDDADSVFGQIVTVMALADQLRGVSGNYGVTSTAGSAGPSPVPSPQPSPSPSLTPGASPSPHATGAGKR